MTNKGLLGFSAVALVVYIASAVGGYYYGKNKGIEEGLDNFHEACYTGGLIVNDKSGRVVQCAPLGQVPKEELPNFFKKGT